ncbi:MAG: hypothetical protein ACI36W_04715 [Coriobacteriales bacterium]
MRHKKTLASMLSLSLAVSFSPLCAAAWAQDIAPASVTVPSTADSEPIPAAQAKASRLLQNLASRYIAKAKTLTNSDDAAVLALGPYLDYQLVLNSLEAYASSSSVNAGTLAKYLTMLAYTQVPEIEPSAASPYVRQLDELLEEQADSLSSYELVWVVSALERWSGNAENLAWAVERLGAFQNEEGLIGGFSVRGEPVLSPEYQATAQAVMALSGFRDNSSVASSTRKEAQRIQEAALQAMLGGQQADGGWLYKPTSTQSDIDTTGWVLGALLMFSASTDHAFSVRLAEEFLVSKADKTLDGYSSCSSEALASSAATLGLFSIFNYSNEQLVLDERNAVVTSLVYDGSKQAPTVSLPWRTLLLGSDYTVSSAHKKVGTYKNTVVSGQGSLTGTFACTFTVKPAEVRAVKATKSGRTLRLSWGTSANKGSGITGYKVTIKCSGKTVASAQATSGGYKASSAKLSIPAAYKGKKLNVSVAAFKGTLSGAAGKVSIVL